MHLSPNLDYPWVLRLTDDELTIMQKVLRGDELSAEEEESADHLSGTLDLIRPKAERTRKNRRSRRRAFRDSATVEDELPVEYSED